MSNAATRPVETDRTTARHETAPIDLAHLGRYTMGNRALELEVLGLFAGQTPQYVEMLKGAVTDKDWGMAAHTIKGSARAVGAVHVAAAAERAERLKGRRDKASEAEAIAEIEAALASAQAFIAALPVAAEPVRARR